MQIITDKNPYQFTFSYQNFPARVFYSESFNLSWKISFSLTNHFVWRKIWGFAISNFRKMDSSQCLFSDKKKNNTLISDSELYVDGVGLQSRFPRPPLAKWDILGTNSPVPRQVVTRLHKQRQRRQLTKTRWVRSWLCQIRELIVVFLFWKMR